MLVKRFLLNALAIGLVAARASPNEGPGAVDGLVSRDDQHLHVGINKFGQLMAREDEDEIPDDAPDEMFQCGVKPCRGDGPCKSTTKKERKKKTSRSMEALQNFRRDLDGSSSLNETEEAELIELVKREIDGPPEGGIDGWFKEQWGKDHMKEVELVDSSPTARREKFEDGHYMLGINGLCGCTTVVIADRNKAYMSHFWELRSFKSVNKGDKQAEKYFEEEVLAEMDRVICSQKFNKGRDSHTKVLIYTKGRPSTGEPEYPKPINMIKKRISEKLQGLAEKDIMVSTYWTTMNTMEDPDKAAGALILSYNSDAEEGQAGYDLWAGDLNEGGRQVPAEEINSPIMSSRWPKSDPKDPVPEDDSEDYEDPPVVEPAPIVLPPPRRNNGKCTWSWCTIL